MKNIIETLYISSGRFSSMQTTFPSLVVSELSKNQKKKKKKKKETKKKKKNKRKIYVHSPNMLINMQIV